ncbi:MAG: hypothetical protein WA384_14770 [Rhodomicrobium sp.]
MYELTSKFRYALRWTARVAALLAFTGVVFVSALPFLVEDRAVHDALIRSLSEWSGGAVTVGGPLQLASFTSLSVEADGVTFAATPRLSPVVRIQAKSVTAILKVPALLRGRIEFKKMVVEQPHFVLGRHPARSKPDFVGLETASQAFAFADLSRFDRIELKDCSFFTPQGEHRPYLLFGAELISITRSPDGSLYNLHVRDRGFDAFFRGNIGGSGETADGSLNLKVSPEHPAAGRIAAAIAPWEEGNSISLAGDLAWAGTRATLDGATIAFGDHSAKGSLAFGVRHGRALMEGTLAYDRLEWMPSAEEAGAGSGRGMEPLKTLILARPGYQPGADLDMRISAEHFRTGPYEAGPLALSLTSRPGAFSVDVAELALFGGKISGRLDYDSAHPAVLTLNASGTRLDSQSMTSALGWPFTMSGPLTLRLALEIPFKEEPLAQEIKAATGSFGIVFPAGGTLDGDVLSRLSAAFERQNLSWGLSSSSFPFTEAAIDGTLMPAGVTLKINGESSGSRIAGSLHVTLPGSEVSGTLTLNPDDPADASQGAAALPNPASVVFSGTVAALNFSASGKPSLSN